MRTFQQLLTQQLFRGPQKPPPGKHKMRKNHIKGRKRSCLHSPTREAHPPWHTIKWLWENTQFPISSQERNKWVWCVSDDLAILQLTRNLFLFCMTHITNEMAVQWECMWLAEKKRWIIVQRPETTVVTADVRDRNGSGALRKNQKTFKAENYTQKTEYTPQERLGSPQNFEHGLS